MKRITSESVQDIGGYLSAWRRALRYPQTYVAAQADISVRTLSNLENGKGEPSLSTVIAVAHALGIRDIIVRAFDPSTTEFGALRMSSSLPTRVR